MKKIVAIGGGTGLYALLSGLKEYQVELTAIVSTMDSGGSSGVLRTELGILPPGDIRNCLIALSSDTKGMYELFSHRFTKGGLANHSVGNLLIAALTELNDGNFFKAIQEAEKILSVKGRVLPVTLQKHDLCARLENGRVLVGEKKLDGKIAGAKIRQVFLKPKASIVLPQALDAIKKADVIILGPGSLYGSVIVNLLVDDLPKVIRKSRAKKIYVCNAMTEGGQTYGFTAADHVAQVEKYLGKNSLDAVIANSKKPSKKAIGKYLKEHAQFVEPNIRSTKKLKAVKGNFITSSELVRYDSKKLAKAIIANC
ncbi:YvcK family protein [Candidatus Micrarchaeota archaeon]|nr:YvcK family protein [Candidatus Micrarchaeota archaeon]